MITYRLQLPTDEDHPHVVSYTIQSYGSYEEASADNSNNYEIVELEVEQQGFNMTPGERYDDEEQQRSPQSGDDG